ncbi:MAG: ABC transporter permease [Acetobacteraceae bacterium]|nr:ABC transporter permease [Acetobacteraceae bacterium]
MIADIWTVMWKEWREYFVQWQWGRARGGVVGVLVLAGVFGVYLPLQTGPAWVRSPTLLAFWGWVPLVLVTSVIADAFAGERERHTLETLLASPLPDLAMLIGKVAAGIAYGWGLSMLNLLLGLVVLNLVYGRHGLLMYPAAIALSIVGLSLLGAALAATAGVLVSLRAETVRQAQQLMSIATMLLFFIPLLGLQALPRSWRESLTASIAAAGPTRLALIAMAILAALDIALLAAAMARFKRSRLILD